MPERVIITMKPRKIFRIEKYDKKNSLILSKNSKKYRKNICTLTGIMAE
jgi:hypothetical protein